MYFKLQLMTFCLSIGITVASSHTYMDKRPNFFVPCSSFDTELEKCLKNNLAAYIINYRYGIPDYPVAGKLEPVHLRKVKLKLNKLNLELRNVTMHGLGDAKVTELVLQPQNLSLQIELLVPRIRVEAIYKVNGNVFFLRLNSKGSFWMETDKNTFAFQTQLELRKTADNLTFASIIKLESQLQNIDGFLCNVKDLFNGNEILETETNELFNANWRDLLLMARPTIESTINAIISIRLKKILKFMPADYFVNDISHLDTNNFTVETA